MSTSNGSSSSDTNNRKYELTVLGATGFTGQRIAQYIAKLQCEGKYNKEFAIAGRNESKLHKVVDEVKSALSKHNTSKIRIAILPNVDTTDESSLTQMAKQTRIVLNAAGPFRFLGPPVVAACVKAKTHLTDVTGEPEFIEKMIVEHDDEAKKNHVTVVHACGFDSVPSDMGTQYAIAEFKKRYGNDAIVSHVEAIFTVHTGPSGARANTGTWNSLVHGLGATKTLQKIRKQLKEKYKAENAKVERLGKPSKPKPTYYEKRLDRPAIMFPGADAAIVRNTQQQLAIAGHKEVQPHFSVYFTVPSRIYVALFAFFGMMLKLFASFKPTRKLLIAYPSFFSFGMFSDKGPTAQQMAETSITFDFFVSGYAKKPNDESQKPDKKLHAKMEAPEPGYVTTPIAIVQSSLTILKDLTSSKHAIPSGVLTPGAAFAKTDIVKDLTAEGVKFSVVD